MEAMFLLIGFLVLLIAFNCFDIVPDHLKEWFNRVSEKEWVYPLVYPIVVILITIGAFIGVRSRVLHPCVYIFVFLFWAPILLFVAKWAWSRFKSISLRYLYKGRFTAREIVVKCLCKMGYDIDSDDYDDDSGFTINYLDENFVIKFSDRFAYIMDPVWKVINVNDPELPVLKEAVNFTNFSDYPTIVMTKPDENGMIQIHSHCSMMLHPCCPDNLQYFISTMNSFFEGKRELYANMQRLLNPTPKA